jgi:hypothetical protein
MGDNNYLLNNVLDTNLKSDRMEIYKLYLIRK